MWRYSQPTYRSGRINDDELHNVNVHDCIQFDSTDDMETTNNEQDVNVEIKPPTISNTPLSFVPIPHFDHTTEVVEDKQI